MIIPVCTESAFEKMHLFGRQVQETQMRIAGQWYEGGRKAKRSAVRNWTSSLGTLNDWEKNAS